MEVRAKFRCEHLEVYSNNYVTAHLGAVTGTADEEAENTKFNKYTPSGKLEISIDDEKLVNYFEPGKEYYLDFNPAE